MYSKLLSYLKKKNVILGSSSIQRQQILQDINFPYRVISSNFEENLAKDSTPEEYVLKTAEHKFKDILQNNKHEDIDLLITSDTIVTKEGVILEKAKNREEAFLWLKGYSDSRIQVTSAVIFGLINRDDDGNHVVTSIDSFDETSIIQFLYMDDETINEYLDIGEWKNRGGAIGVQLFGKLLVEKIDGCFYNIVGFPISRFMRQLNCMLLTEI